MPEQDGNGVISIGKRIQTARKNKGISLALVANETGFSTQYLEQVESDQTMPSVGAVLQISRALDIDSDLILKEQQETGLTNRIHAWTKRTDNYAYKTLSSGLEKKHLKAFLVTVDPMKEHSGVGYRHEGEEFVYVLSGRMEVVVGENVNILDQGESLHFNSGVKHKMKNLSDQAAELIVVLYVP